MLFMEKWNQRNGVMTYVWHHWTGQNQISTKRRRKHQKRRIWKITAREDIILSNRVKYTKTAAILSYENWVGVTFPLFGWREIICTSFFILLLTESERIAMLP